MKRICTNASHVSIADLIFLKGFLSLAQPRIISVGMKDDGMVSRALSRNFDFSIGTPCYYISCYYTDGKSEEKGRKSVHFHSVDPCDRSCCSCIRLLHSFAFFERAVGRSALLPIRAANSSSLSLLLSSFQLSLCERVDNPSK